MRTLAGILVGALLLAALIHATLKQTAVECSVCVEHAGRRACATVSAADREQALAQAVSTACATISSGVTDGIRCSSTPPSSVECSDDS